MAGVPKPSMSQALALAKGPSVPGSARPAEPLGPPPKRARRDEGVVDPGKEAGCARVEMLVSKAANVSESPMNHQQVVFASVQHFVKVDYPVPGLGDFTGVYITVGFLNGKPCWKSQETGTTESPLSPRKTGYLWWSPMFELWIFSILPMDERAIVDDLDSLGFQCSFSENFSKCFCPWNASEATDKVKLSSFHDWAHGMLDHLVRKVRRGEAEDAADIGHAVGPATFSKAASSAASASKFGVINKPPPAVTPAKSAGFETINQPPAPVSAPSESFATFFAPSVKKSGYFSKAIAYMVAIELGLQERSTQIKNFCLQSPAFQQMYRDHMEQMVRWGEDPRFDYK